MGQKRTVVFTQDLNREAIIQTLLLLSPGATVTPSIGIYKDDNGGMVVEDSLTITIVHDDAWDGLAPLVQWLKDDNGQTEVIYETFDSAAITA